MRPALAPALALAAGLLAGGGEALAKDPGPGGRLAAPCAICHGTAGQPATRDVASLAGLPRDHIAAQMRAFRDGTRTATVMHQIARGYSDEQIDQLAAWFAAQKR